MKRSTKKRSTKKPKRESHVTTFDDVFDYDMFGNYLQFSMIANPGPKPDTSSKQRFGTASRYLDFDDGPTPLVRTPRRRSFSGSDSPAIFSLGTAANMITGAHATGYDTAVNLVNKTVELQEQRHTEEKELQEQRHAEEKAQLSEQLKELPYSIEMQADMSIVRAKTTKLTLAKLKQQFKPNDRIVSGNNVYSIAGLTDGQFAPIMSANKGKAINVYSADADISTPKKRKKGSSPAKLVINAKPIARIYNEKDKAKK